MTMITDHRGDKMPATDVSARMDAITQIGRLVRLTTTRYRHAYWPALSGSLGTVASYDGHRLVVTMDDGSPSEWSVEYGERPWEDIEPLGNCGPVCAEQRGGQDCPGDDCAYRP